MRCRLFSRVLPVLLFLLPACSGEKNGDGGGAGSKVLDDLEPIAVDTSNLAAAFTIASAPNLYALLAYPIGIATTSTSSCPILEVTDFSTTVRGPCTDAEGTVWSGELRMTGFSDVALELDAFGFASTSSCGSFALPGGAIWDGDAHLTHTATGLRFDADLTFDPRESGCARFDDLLAVDYAGETVNGPDADLDGAADFSTWNGTGRVGLLGAGRVRATTIDEHLDGISVGGGPGEALGEGTPTPAPPCYFEAASGTTRLEGGDAVAEIVYDGNVSCDPLGSAGYVLDGTFVSNLTGVACSAVPASGASPFAPLALLAIGLASLRRRR